MTNKPTNWFVYLLECKNGKLYCGISTDVTKRFDAHCAGMGAAFTRANPPLRVIGFTSCVDRSEASKLEYAVKKLTPEKKRALALDWSSSHSDAASKDR